MKKEFAFKCGIINHYSEFILNILTSWDENSIKESGANKRPLVLPDLIAERS